MDNIFTPVKTKISDSISANKRGKAYSIADWYGSSVAKTRLGDVKVHDDNFAFLTTTLAKLNPELATPLHNVTYVNDIPIEVGGGFVDYVQYNAVNYAGIMSQVRNVVSNNANYIPRVNAGLSQKKVDVYTFEVAYDIRFIELEKMKKLTLQKSIQEIYESAIIAGWDFFCQEVAYNGINGATGLFNSTNVKTYTISNSSTTGSGFEGLTDSAVVSAFNAIFMAYLTDSGMNLSVLPDTILVPSFVGKDLSSRFSSLYTSTLRKFIVDHNIGIDEGADLKVEIKSRAGLDTLGTAGEGRIVAYRKNKRYVRLDMPYPIQHFITLPNIDKMSYTTAFVGQVSGIQLPYNENSSDLGIVTYWDFTN